MTIMRFVLRVVPVVSGDGSTATHYFSPSPWVTGPGDTPANTPVRGLLRSPGTLRRELFAGRRVTGAIRPSYGAAVLANPARTADGAGELDDWIDYGLAGAEIELYWGDTTATFPSGYTTVYKAFCHSFVADADSITLRQRDALQLLDQPIVTDAFQGTGGIEGNGGVAKRKQFVSQDPGLIEPILIDANRQIYFVQSTGTSGLHDTYVWNTSVEVNAFDVFDSGVELTRVAPHYASAAALLASAPGEGEVRYWFGPVSQRMPTWYDGPVYFRLGSPPAGPLRVFAYGGPTDADADRLGRLVGSFTAAHLALRAGVPLANVSADSALPVISALVDDDRTYADVLADQALALQGWFGFTRLGVFRSGYLQDPSDGTSVHTFTERDTRALRREPVQGMEVPVWSVSATAGDTWPCQLAGGASATLREYLSREVWMSFSGVSAAAKLRDPGADHQTVQMRGRLIQNSFGITQWLTRYFELYGGARHFYTFEAPMSATLLALDLHDVVTLQHRRFGLSAGADFRIVGIDIDCAAAVPLMRFTLWGGDAGVFSGGTSSSSSTGGASGSSTGSSISPLTALQTLGAFTGVMVGGATAAGGAAAGFTAADMGEFTGQIIGLPGDAYWPQVALLVQGGSGSDVADLSDNADTQALLTGVAWDSGQTMFGVSTLNGTHVNPTVTPFSGTQFVRSSTTAYTIECWVRFGSSANFSTVGPLWRWTDTFGTLVSRLSFTSNTGELVYATVYASNSLGVIAADADVFVQLNVQDDNTWAIYVDGVSKATGVTSPSAATTGTFELCGGNSSTTDACDYWVGPTRVTIGVARDVATPVGLFETG